MNASRLVPWLLLILLVTGCTSPLQKHLYGRVAEPIGPEAQNAIKVTLPQNAPSITQPFWSNTPGNSKNAAKNSHRGIDIVAVKGTPVIAPASGTIAAVAYDPMSGKRLVIDHGPDDSGALVTTWYFHLNEYLVKTDDRVERGQPIGTVGATGLLAPFPHLHFEVHRKAIVEKAVNPHLYWVDGPGIVTCFDVSRDWPQGSFRATYPLPCVNTVWRR